MRGLVDLVGYVNLALFTLLAVLALRQWRAGRGKAGLWAALTFAVLALVADSGLVLPDTPETTLENAAVRVLIGLLVLFPFLLYRFTTAFEPPTRLLERLLGVMTVILLAWTFLLPEIPKEGEPRTAAFTAFVIAFLFHWTTLSIVVAFRLWHAGRGQPGVARRRMQLLSAAAVALAVVLIAAAFASGDEPAVDLAVALATTLSAGAFLLGLAPPEPLRAVWRKDEIERMRVATAGLMTATTAEDVAQQVLPHAAQLVGAGAAALRVHDGEWLGAYGATDAMLAALGGPDPDAADVIRIEIPNAELVFWTTPYAPFFGAGELNLAHGIGNLTGLALDRSRLFAHERESRLALERADEVKTNFVALAAHELRTPVASIKGIVETLDARRGQLGAERTAELERILRQQADRMAMLVEQLLDLSRLDADSVPIHPQPIAVRQRLEELVGNAAGERRGAVRIDVAPDLAALVDPGAFDRIVSNLVVNALRYGAAPVVVTAERADRHFRLAVEDCGEGVPPAFVPDLFERFTRSEETRQRAGGSGLGLAIARSYAQAHRGDLLYEPAEPHGARFKLVLPAE